jgi:hypothetical protein
MTLCDITGYLASGLVLAAFCMKDIVPLRLVALCSNVAFLIYGVNMGLIPIWLLHGLLLPMNGWRLVQTLLERRPFSEAVPPADRSQTQQGVFAVLGVLRAKIHSNALFVRARSEAFKTVRALVSVPAAILELGDESGAVRGSGLRLPITERCLPWNVDLAWYWRAY